MDRPRQPYAMLANAVTLFHALWTALLLGGIVAVLVYPQYAWVQICVLSVTILINLPFGNKCPLTLIEEKLRREYDPTYRNQHSFATTYLNKMLGTRFRPAQVNAIIIVLYIGSYALSIAVLAWK